MIRRKPKILIFHHALHLGGVERSLIGLLRALPPDAVTIDLALLDNAGELLSQVPRHVKILAPKSAFRALLGPIQSALLSRHFFVGLARLLARALLAARSLIGLPRGFLLARSFRYALPFLPRIDGEYDLAISFMMPHDIVAAKVSSKRKAGWIHTDYTSVETGVAASFEVRGWEKMDDIISVSPDVSQSFSKVFPSQASKIKLIENCLDPTWVRDMAERESADEVVKDGKFTLCSVGRLTHPKAFDEAAVVSRRLRNLGLDHRWYVIGFGPDENLIRQKIVEQGVQDSFILLGKKTNPYPYMKACDIYVQPSRYEGKAVAVREAQMLKKPVVIAGFSTAPSQLDHDVDGIIAEPGIDGLVKAIHALAHNASLRARLSMATASRDYGNLNEVDKVLALIPCS